MLGKKADHIDEEVALLHELKEIVLDFMQEIRQLNFSDNADVKQLYDKTKDIESRLISVDYIGKPANINRLVETAEKVAPPLNSAFSQGSWTLSNLSGSSTHTPVIWAKCTKN